MLGMRSKVPDILQYREGKTTSKHAKHLRKLNDTHATHERHDSVKGMRK